MLRVLTVQRSEEDFGCCLRVTIAVSIAGKDLITLASPGDSVVDPSVGTHTSLCLSALFALEKNLLDSEVAFLGFEDTVVRVIGT